MSTTPLELSAARDEDGTPLLTITVPMSLSEEERGYVGRSFLRLTSFLNKDLERTAEHRRSRPGGLMFL